MDGTYIRPLDPDIYFKPAGQFARGRQGFWGRQFGDSPTETQFRFDVAFGLVVPVLCFVFDPVVFHWWMDAGGGIFGGYRLFAYGASGAEMATLAFWLFAARRFPVWSRPAGGVMLAGGIFSSMVGVLILPFSVLGILIGGIGLLGFIPFVTAVIYLRNGARALRLNRVTRPVPGAAFAALVFGLLVALGPALALQVGAVRAVNVAFREVVAGRRLSPLRLCVVRALALASDASIPEAVREYRYATDEAHKSHLASAYRQVTGGEISERRRTWLDD